MRVVGDPPPHVGGYSLAAFRAGGEISGLSEFRRRDGALRLNGCAPIPNLRRVPHDAIAPNPWMILPFALLLGLIALAPLLFGDWWLKHYQKVALSLGAVTLGYYLFGLHAYGRPLETAEDYVKFIALIGSLFVVSGGIHISVKGEATPLGNVVFLLIGAVLANVLGTTGASMLLIRPWIRMNKYRVTAHHIVFFIFIVSNVGGCLTPIGDPPLFLGFLKGIPFWWVAEHCWPMWATGLGICWRCSS